MISVLYVDDEPDLLILARIFLERAGGFQVATSTSAQESLDSPSLPSYDAIVSDYQMPGMDGIEFLTAIRERIGTIPFILFTGRGREEVVIDAINNGADFYLQKGGDPRAQFAELENKIRYAVERKHVEEELAASEERYRSVVNDQTEMIARFTPEGIITFANAAYESYFSRQLGLSGIKGRTFREIMDIMQYTGADEFPGSLTRETPTRDVEYVLTARDGKKLWQHWSVRARFGENGDPLEYQVVGRDVTAEKLAEVELKRKNDELNESYERIAINEEELRQQLDELTVQQEALKNSEEKFRAFTENIPDLTTIVDMTGVYTYVSPSIQRLTGWDEDALLGKKFADIDAIFGTGPEGREILLKTGQIAVQKPGEPVPVPPFRVRDSRGETLFIEGSNTYLPDVKGIQGILFHGRDITDRIRAEEALGRKTEELRGRYEELAAGEKQIREREEMYRRILENMQDAYLRLDRDGNLLMVSPSAARIYGYGSPAEMIGMPSSVLYSNPGQHKDLLSKINQQGKITDFAGAGKRKDGTTFWASLNVQYIFDEAGNIAGIEVMVRDVSESRAMERAIQEANRKLNLLNSITRHDVVNQLTILEGYVQLAAMRDPGPVVADFLDKIGATAEIISRQIAFTKAYQELGVHTPAWFRLDETLSTAGRTDVTISGTCRLIEIFADPMLERVFSNIFENATRHGGKVTGISVRCEREPDSLVIIIEDDGVGIAPGEKEKIFGKGYGKNTGFGLFLAREILAITGITIRETGYLGVGARFEITVPKERWRVDEGQ
ncbi:PAS domain S-box protein [Methanoregula sp.]|uniref:hybrid sensor histidine kinase/response regulator n=1 Tax=Methanoregula sp. TaxID=2052170 RepID=UPI00236FED4C|nr:PAS domain S-box protein [Methanoregula sp.]MDD1687370.1 PAS domain S-box protein [Methanoregula sp.]